MVGGSALDGPCDAAFLVATVDGDWLVGDDMGAGQLAGSAKAVCVVFVDGELWQR